MPALVPFCCREGKEQVTARLRKLLKRLRACNLIDRGFVIGRARVPIIKCITLGGKHALDISLGTSNGAAAVTLLRAQIELCPPLRPLALVIRALLKVRVLERQQMNRREPGGKATGSKSGQGPAGISLSSQVNAACSCFDTPAQHGHLVGP